MFKGRYLKEFKISNKRYKELCGFCEQYPEWKKEINDYSFIKGISYSAEPKSITNNISSPTENMAFKISELSSKVLLIENTAKEADPEFWEFIIESACYEAPAIYLITKKGMPLSKTAFYNRRQYFFYLLDQKKG